MYLKQCQSKSNCEKGGIKPRQTSSPSFGKRRIFQLTLIETDVVDLGASASREQPTVTHIAFLRLQSSLMALERRAPAVDADFRGL